MKKGVLSRVWRQRHLQVFVWLGLLFLLIFHYLPMFGIVIAFEDFKISSGILGMFTSDFVGFKHFAAFFTDYKFLDLLTNTLVLSLLKLVFTFPLPIFLALVLNECHVSWFKRTVQTVSYLPYFISWVIVAGFCQILLTNTGAVNDLMEGMFGTRLQFLTSPALFRPLAVVTAMWKETGWWTIIFLAAIAGIDPTLYEAAEIDGASRLKRMWHITLPGIAPTVTVVLILALGNLLGGGLSGSNFEQSYLMGNAGNYETSEILQTYILNIGLSKGRFSYATAAGLFQSVISVLLVFASNFVSKRVSGEGLF